jgi:threonine 3-dehydrogenase
MTTSMRALVKDQPARGISMREVPVPQPDHNEVLIKVEKTAICGTDLHIYSWDEWSQRNIRTPLVIGHEFVGRITAMGAGVRGYEIGQRVSAEGHIVCGVCRNCRAGKQHLCPNTIGIGVNRDGAFAEYVTVPTSNLWPIPDAIAPELAAFFDPFGNAAHCALQHDLVGEDVLITGAGPIGIIAAGICRHVGARHVVISDLNDYRLQLARDMGASHTINVKHESIADAVKALEIDGFDIGLEMSGSPIAFNDMLKAMFHGGHVAMLGILPNGSGIDWDQVIFKGLELHGIYGRRMYETWYKMTQMVLTGFPLHKAMSHHIPIDDYERGFELMAAGECGKVVCDWTGEVAAKNAA